MLGVYSGSKLVRVRREIEELIEYLADKFGVTPSTVRNIALIYGLNEILLHGIPLDNEEANLLLDRITKMILSNKVIGGEEEEEEE